MKKIGKSVENQEERLTTKLKERIREIQEWKYDEERHSPEKIREFQMLDHMEMHFLYELSEKKLEGFDEDFLTYISSAVERVHQRKEAMFNVDADINSFPHYRHNNLPSGKSEATVFGEKSDGLNYEYSDRLSQWDRDRDELAGMYAYEDVPIPKSHYHRNTQRNSESYLSHYHDGKPVSLRHIIGGVNRSNGYPYAVYGYKILEEVDLEQMKAKVRNRGLDPDNFSTTELDILVEIANEGADISTAEPGKLSEIFNQHRRNLKQAEIAKAIKSGAIKDSYFSNMSGFSHYGRDGIDDPYIYFILEKERVKSNALSLGIPSSEIKGKSMKEISVMIDLVKKEGEELRQNDSIGYIISKIKEYEGFSLSSRGDIKNHDKSTRFYHRKLQEYRKKLQEFIDQASSNQPC